MKSIIDQFVFDHDGNGLLLLNSPTGSGKTYNGLQWAYSYLISNEKKKRKIFFTTPLKKNLPIEDAKIIFKENGDEELFNNIVLFLDSNSEAVLSNFENAIRYIPDDSIIIDRNDKDRDWDQFHSPENLAKSVSIEAGELLECFQWNNEYDLENVTDEMADVFVYLLDLADKLDVDLIDIADKKMDKNIAKYPIDKAKGKSVKYNKL